MFTAKPQKNLNSATEYFDEHLSQNDYYTEQESQAGYWIGQGAERLGLKNETGVARESFLRLCDNQHPETGAKLTQIQLSERRIFFDFTCSAPKSVSILAVTMDDKRIVQAHREAASIALRELEAFAAARVRILAATGSGTPAGCAVGATNVGIFHGGCRDFWRAPCPSNKTHLRTSACGRASGLRALQSVESRAPVGGGNFDPSNR